MLRTAVIAIVVVFSAHGLMTQGAADWAQIGRRCEAAIDEAGDARFRELYLVCLFGIATEADRELGRSIARGVYDGAALAIRGVDTALHEDEAGGGREADMWVRARASSLPLAQARAAVLLLATGVDDSERAALAEEIVGLINATNGRDDAQATTMRALAASAALALGEYATSVELYAQAMHVVATATDRDGVLRAHGAEIAMGSALAAARVGGAVRGRELLDRAVRGEPFVGAGGANARLLLAGADALARIELEADGGTVDAVARICDAYGRLLRRDDLAAVRGVLRADIMDRLGRIVPERIATSDLATLGALARAAQMFDAGRREDARVVLDVVRSRRDLRGEDLSHCLRMRASCEDGSGALRFLMEHAEKLPSHMRTPEVLRAGARLAAGVLAEHDAADGAREEAVRFVRLIRDRYPESDPAGAARAALGVYLSRDAGDLDALLESAETWHSIKDILRIGTRAEAGQVACLIAAVRASNGAQQREVARHLIQVCGGASGAFSKERAALIAAGRTIGYAAAGDDGGCIDASEGLLVLDSVTPREDLAAVAISLGARYGALARVSDISGAADTVERACEILGAYAGEIVSASSEDAWTALSTQTNGFWAGVHPADDAGDAVQILEACARWSDAHDARSSGMRRLRLAAALVAASDGERAIRVLDGAGEGSMSRYIRAEALLLEDKTREAFGVYRAQAERFDAAREFGAEYFRCWVRMLEILESRDDAADHAARIRSEVQRLLGHEAIEGFPACVERVRSLSARLDANGE